jgi:cytochrome c biogenesis protein CcdA
MTLVLAFLAGALTTLNPCVLPMLPLLGATAAGERTPWMMAAGLVMTFTLIGMGGAALGATLGLPGDALRLVAALALLLSGLALAWRPARVLFSRWLTPLAGVAAGAATGVPSGTPIRELGVGVLLGAVWSPCTGPTLAAATAVATQQQSLSQAGGVMLVFSTGMAGVFLVGASLLKRLPAARRLSLGTAAGRGRDLFGWSLAAIGVLVLSGMDRLLESWLVQAMPPWLLALTTRF